MTVFGDLARLDEVRALAAQVREQAPRLRARLGARPTVNALHPGVIGTKLLATGFGPGGASVERGAATSVRLVWDDALAGVTGRYFSDEREVTSAPQSHDEALQEALWRWSSERVGLPASD